MKKILFALLGFMAAAPFAVADNIKMVTYFPVPYASYGDLGVTGTCDVGLLGNCTLDAGEKLSVYKLSSDSRALNTGSLIANRGVLALNSSKSSSEIGTDTLFSRRSGGAQVVAPGVLEFAHDLTVDTIEGATIQSAEATKRADMTDLYLFSPASGRRFPACDATNNKMEWSQLTINGDKGVFLVCGEGEKIELACSGNSSEPCGCNNAGVRTRECNTSTGNWGAWSACSIDDCGCSDRTYKLAHKSECCIGQPYTDADCYSWTLYWRQGSVGDRWGSDCSTRWESSGTTVSECEDYTENDCLSNPLAKTSSSFSICQDELRDGYYSVGDSCLMVPYEWVCEAKALF